MQEWIIDVMNQFGYFGIALLIAVENVFPPIPSEVILTFGGFMTTYSSMSAPLVILFATMGSVVGAIILYLIGTLITPERLGVILDKWGKFLRVKRDDITRAEGWFTRHGSLTVLFCRFIPIIRSLISIPAGMSRMKLGKFLAYTSLGTLIWNIVLVYLGVVTGANWEKITMYIGTYSNIALAAFVLIGIVFFVWFIRKRRARP